VRAKEADHRKGREKLTKEHTCPVTCPQTCPYSCDTCPRDCEPDTEDVPSLQHRVLDACEQRLSGCPHAPLRSGASQVPLSDGLRQRSLR